MKFSLLFTFIAFCTISITSQTTINSVDVIKYPDKIHCGNATCDSGKIDIKLNNPSSNYLWSVYSLRDSSAFNRHGVSSIDSILLNTCYDTLIIYINDTANSSFDKDTLTQDSLECPVDTTWVHPHVPISSVHVLRYDNLSFPYGKIQVVPVGGHQPGYFYRLDTVLRGSSPQPPTIFNPGYANYRGAQDTVIFDTLPWRWYGVICIDTTRLIPILSVKQGYDCAICDTLTIADTLKPSWVFVPKTGSCNLNQYADCNPFTGTSASSYISGGMPPFNVTITNTTTSTIVYSQKVYNYSGFYNTPTQNMTNCDNYSFSITDSLGYVSCTYSAGDQKEAIVSSVSSTQTRLGTCCDGSMTFTFQTQSCGGNSYYSLIDPNNITVSVGLITNNVPITVNQLCAGNYRITDGSCDTYHNVIMNDRPCDSSASINELKEKLPTINLFPNPTSSFTEIKMSSETLLKNVNLSIIDQIGRVIFKDIIPAEGQSNINHTIDLSGLISGNYTIIMVVNDNIIRKKLIKQ